MNRKKLEIIKKVLSTHNWTLKGSATHPNFIYVFDGNGKLIARRNNEQFRNFIYHFYVHKKIRHLFGFYSLEIKEIMKIIVNEEFGWRMSSAWHAKKELEIAERMGTF